MGSEEASRNKVHKKKIFLARHLVNYLPRLPAAMLAVGCISTIPTPSRAQSSDVTQKRIEELKSERAKLMRFKSSAEQEAQRYRGNMWGRTLESGKNYVQGAGSTATAVRVGAAGYVPAAAATGVKAVHTINQGSENAVSAYQQRQNALNAERIASRWNEQIQRVDRELRQEQKTLVRSLAREREAQRTLMPSSTAPRGLVPSSRGTPTAPPARLAAAQPLPFQRGVVPSSSNAPIMRQAERGGIRTNSQLLGNDGRLSQRQTGRIEQTRLPSARPQPQYGHSYRPPPPQNQYDPRGAEIAGAIFGAALGIAVNAATSGRGGQVYAPQPYYNVVGSTPSGQGGAGCEPTPMHLINSNAVRGWSAEQVWMLRTMHCGRGLQPIR